jgi:hypothetical protein
VKPDTDLALLLARALGFRLGTNSIDPARVRAQRYGFQAVAADEQAREARTQILLVGFRARFIDGPTLRFPRAEELRRSFNPNNLITFGDNGTVYPSGTFTSRWGRLQIDDVGALLSPDNQSIRIVAPSDVTARPLVGPGWRLELAPGWTVRPASRAGDFDVVAERQ